MCCASCIDRPGRGVAVGRHRKSDLAQSESKACETGVIRCSGEPVDQELVALGELSKTGQVYQVVRSGMQAVCRVCSGQARKCGADEQSCVMRMCVRVWVCFRKGDYRKKSVELVLAKRHEAPWWEGGARGSMLRTM